MIQIENLTKIYPQKKGKEIIANNNITLSIKEGEIVGLLGHNGAGKTTLVNQILGLTKSTKGEISVLGKSITQNPEQGRFLCSVQPQSQLPLRDLTPLRAVTILGCLRGGRENDVEQEAMRLFKNLDIDRWSKVGGQQLSGGVLRLTAFCMAVINSKKVVILDEPTNDVDPVRRRYLWREIRKITQTGKGVVLVTHNVLEAEKAVDRVAILDEGKVIIQGRPAEIKSKHSNDLRVKITSSNELKSIDIPKWSLSAYDLDGSKTFSIKQEDVSKTIEWLREEISLGNISDYFLSETTLEDIYVKLTEKMGGRNHESCTTN